MNGEIRTYFELEARELVDRLTRGVALLDGGAASPENVQSLQRAAHTLKGAAHVVGEAGIAALAHDFEDALAQYLQVPDTSGAARLLALTDELASALSATFAAFASLVIAQPANASSAEDRTQAGVSEPGTSAAEASRATVRVDHGETSKLLTQINIGGGLVASLRGRLQQLTQLQSEMDLDSGPGDGSRSGAHGQASGNSGWPQRLNTLREELQHDLERLDRQIGEVHRAASRLSLVSTSSLLIEAGRIVRSTAAAVQREVVCVTQGGGDRVDLQIVGALQDALLHLIRNAVVHGVESPAERHRAGKPRAATITVGVTRSGSDVVMTCRDDGCGIALEPIRVAAVDRGLMTLEEASAADAATLLALLLRPGFSTRRSADEMAGRGVGLEAVHAVAEQLHGEVRIDSEPGRGTLFTLTAPRTFFSLTVLEVTAGGVRYAIPIDAVEQTFRLEPHLKVAGQGSRTVLLNCETMPYLALQDVMPSPAVRSSALGASRSAPLTCVVLRAESGPLALAVDRVETTNEVLMQPLPAITGAHALVAGAALSPGGQPFLVLNPAALLKTIMEGGTAQIQSANFEGHSVGPILVIDDSLTTRMLEQSILEGEGYRVDLAVSAEQGLDMARQKRYSLFLVDVEMPGMNGFDFVRTAKADVELGSIPSMLVTSLDSAADRERGRAAGAVSYVVKGEFNQQVYLDRIRAVMRSAS